MKALIPEIDTIRLQWHCGNLFNIDRFFEGEGLKKILIVERNPLTHEITNHWEKIRTDHRKSWFGKMQIIDDRYSWGKSGQNWCRCVSFEFSLAKWRNYSNGFNYGTVPSVGVAFDAVCEAMRVLGAFKYSKFRSVSRMEQHIRDCSTLRRLDLSLNFKVPSNQVVDDWIEWLGRVVVNQQESQPYGNRGNGSARVWSSPASAYRITWYNKEVEQKHYFHMVDYATTLTEQKMRLLFYEQIKEKLKNIFRFEIQFRNKWFKGLTAPNKEIKLDEKPKSKLTNKEKLRLAIMKNGIMGEDNINKVIDYSVIKWKELLKLFKKQLDYTNFKAGDCSRIQDNSGVEYVLGQITGDIRRGEISPTVGNSMKCFLLDCYTQGWKSVQSTMTKEKWYYERSRILKNYGYDVKCSLPAECPIIAIMQTGEDTSCITKTLCQSKPLRDLSKIKFVPAPVFDASEIYHFVESNIDKMGVA